MAIDEGLYAWVEEAMAPLGPVTRRAMTGGATLRCGGIVFAILAADALRHWGRLAIEARAGARAHPTSQSG